MTPGCERTRRRAAKGAVNDLREPSGAKSRNWLGSESLAARSPQSRQSPDVGIQEGPGELVIELRSRLIDPRRLHLELSGNVLTVSGAIYRPEANRSGYLAFSRRIVLPGNVDLAHLDARVRGRILTLTIPKHRAENGSRGSPASGPPDTVAQVMSRDVLSVSTDVRVSDAAQLLESFNIGSVPVSHDRKLVGILTDRDIALRVTSRALDPMRITVGEVMTPRPLTCRPEDTLGRAEEIMGRAQVRRLPVVDREGSLVGYLALAKIARHDGERRVGRLLREVSESRPRGAVRGPPNEESGPSPASPSLH